MADIVVLGAGVCGLASAALLSEEGHDVVVLEWDRTGRWSPSRRRGRAGRVIGVAQFQGEQSAIAVRIDQW